MRASYSPDELKEDDREDPTKTRGEREMAVFGRNVSECQWWIVGTCIRPSTRSFFNSMEFGM